MLPSRGANAALRSTDVTGALDVGLPSWGQPPAPLGVRSIRAHAAGLAALGEARRGWSTSVILQAAALVSEVGAGRRCLLTGSACRPAAAQRQRGRRPRRRADDPGQRARRRGDRRRSGGALLSSGEVLGGRAEPVAAPDTTGAGDAFDAGPLAAWVAGADPAAALAAGVCAGIAVITGRARRSIAEVARPTGPVSPSDQNESVGI